MNDIVDDCIIILGWDPQVDVLPQNHLEILERLQFVGSAVKKWG